MTGPIHLSTSLRSMTEAPKERPILAWCMGLDISAPLLRAFDGANTYAFYLFHFAPARPGWNVIEWVCGEVGDDGDGRDPDWWFLRDSDHERPAWPVAWIDIPMESEMGELLEMLESVL